MGKWTLSFSSKTSPAHHIIYLYEEPFHSYNRSQVPLLSSRPHLGRSPRISLMPSKVPQQGEALLSLNAAPTHFSTDKKHLGCQLIEFSIVSHLQHSQNFPLLFLKAETDFDVGVSRKYEPLITPPVSIRSNESNPKFRAWR